MQFHRIHIFREQHVNRAGKAKAYASGLITLPKDMMAADSGAEPEETEVYEDEE